MFICKVKDGGVVVLEVFVLLMSLVSEFGILLKDISFLVKFGEIFGFGGVVGNG